MNEILTQLFGDAVTDELLSRFNAELGKRFVAKADYTAVTQTVRYEAEQYVFDRVNVKYSANTSELAANLRFEHKYRYQTKYSIVQPHKTFQLLGLQAMPVAGQTKKSGGMYLHRPMLRPLKQNEECFLSIASS